MAAPEYLHINRNHQLTYYVQIELSPREYEAILARIIEFKSIAEWVDADT